MHELDRTRYVDLREGPAPATIPGDVVSRLLDAAGGEAAAEAGLETAALLVVRLGAEAGEAMLRHLVDHDAALLLDADPLLIRTLANDPELIVGPLAGTASCIPLQ